jgi:fructan beta-fructosidase
MTSPLLLGLAIALATLQEPVTAPDVVVGEFEGAEFAPWTAEGDAFAKGPARGALPAALEIRGVRGDGVASSEQDGDGPTGTLTSPPFAIDRRYLSFVIGGGRYERDTCLDLVVDDKVVKSATGDDSDDLSPQSWDVGRFRGKTARLRIVDRATGEWGHVNVDHIVLTDRPDRPPVVTQPLYRETLRPQFHFTARQWTVDRLNPRRREEGWINDLNGLVYYEGEYHLFAQRWNKCWLHAVSRDLVHWTELEPAFWEEALGVGVQSGNCVIDYGDTSGLSGDPKDPAMVAFWSRNDNKSHGISYSLDRGRTWKYGPNNPVLVRPERDPMVFRHKPTDRWAMVMYGENAYHIFTSENLLDWRDERSSIANSFECPDIFELPLDGNPDDTRWVLVRGDGRYSLGRFDGKSFEEQTGLHESDGGPNFYATQTWGNTETGDGRRIQCAWMAQGAYPDMPFNQQLTFPRELTLRSTPAGPRLFRQPVREIASLHDSEEAFPARTLKDGESTYLSRSGDLFRIKMEVDVPQGATLTLDVRGVPLVLSHAAIACKSAPQTVQGALRSAEILVDRTSIEAFANDGEASTSTCFLPIGEDLKLTADGGDVALRSLTVHRLKSAWTIPDDAR